MKQLILSAFIILVCFTSKAQFNGKISDVNIHKDSMLVFNNPNLNLPKYKYLFENEKGKIFESPVDKMLCLVPDFHSNMPVTGLNKIKPEPMPNVLPDGIVPPSLNIKK